jgi:hypothetical protein
LRGPAHAIEESYTHNNIPQTNPNFETSNPTPTHLAQEMALTIKLTISTQCIPKSYMLLGFLEKLNSKASKDESALTTYKM